jgi:tRNA dimethylallyltransferase
MMSTNLKSANDPVFLVGATGTGKSAAAMELARAWARLRPGSTAILCLDAMQVYRGADIGTSKPTAAERAEFPHGGLDLVEFGAPFDVAQYLKYAAAFLGEQREAGRRVIIVGGTGLYFRALTRGLCEAPQASMELRAELAALSTDELRVRLRQVDPGMLERVDGANPRRLARAIEVMEASGKSLQSWQEETPEPLVKDFTALWIQRKRDELFERIEARVEAMFAAGWGEEVRGLVERFGAEAVKAFPGIGYGEIAEGMQEAEAKIVSGPSTAPKQVRLAQDDGALMGGLRRSGAGPAPATLQLVKSNIVVATRQYAKRQLTWFAREPNLQQVLLTGQQPLSTVVSSLL